MICGGRRRGIFAGPELPEGVIMKIGGWKTRSVFERYAIVSQTDISDAMLKLESGQKRDKAKAADIEKSAASKKIQFGQS